MIHLWVTIIGLQLILVAKSMRLVLVPTNSEICKSRLQYPYTSISVTQMFQFDTGVEDNETMLINYMCDPKFIPLGKLVMWPSKLEVKMKFWYLRIYLEGYFPTCNSRLIIEETATHRDEHELKPIKHEINCKSRLPHIVQAVYRNVKFKFYHDGPVESVAKVSVSISKYVRFNLNMTTEVRRTRCLNAQDLFFCNSTEVCIPGTARCDGLDDCFDGEGGSDEIDCFRSYDPSNNGTIEGPFNNIIHGSWMSNLPWIALGILPVILVFALARICSQKRQLDIGEDYKMGFNTEDEEEGDEGAANDPGMTRSERSVSPDDAASGRTGCHEDYADEGYSLPRHKKTMSASSDYLPANFAELTASPANRTRRPENERSTAPPPFGAVSPAKNIDNSGPQQPTQQQVVAVQINNPVYGNNVYVDVPTHNPMIKDEYTRPKPAVMPPPTKGIKRNGREEYTPLLPPLPPGVAGPETAPGDSPFPPPPPEGRSSEASYDYEDEPPPYDDLMTPPPPVAHSGGEGDKPEMLHLKPLLRPSGATTSSDASAGAVGGSSSSKASSPLAPNGSTAATSDRNNRDSDYDKNYIVV